MGGREVLASVALAGAKLHQLHCTGGATSADIRNFQVRLCNYEKEGGKQKMQVSKGRTDYELMKLREEEDKIVLVKGLCLGVLITVVIFMASFLGISG